MVFYRHDRGHHDEEFGKRINVSSSQNHVEINGLDGGRKYQVSVAVFSTALGPLSEWQTIIAGKVHFYIYRHVF